MRTGTHDALTNIERKQPSRLSRSAALALNLAHPLVILGAWRFDAPRMVGLVLLVLLWLQRWLGAGRVGTMLRGLSTLDWCVALALSGASAFIAITGSELAMRCYPALVSLGLFAVFFRSVVRPPSMIERFARAHGAMLDARGVRYTRRITQFWCVFFTMNAAFSVYTACFLSREAWAFYNGALVYGLIGTLIAVEWLWRRFVVRPVEGAMS